MLPLDKGLRNTFERKIKEAREIAEEASQVAIRHLGVGEASPYNHLTDTERNLRRKLRARGRQLGDKRDSQNQTQEIDRLVEEVAYEHWHRMLFARFLAENQLLMYPDPDHPVAITLEECEDLASDEGAKNGWDLASRFAAQMLPQIFRPDSPVFEIEFPPEYQQRLERILIELPSDVFIASDSLGWVYQYWQSKKKDEVNDKEIKIGSRELPVVTQLFTDPYMVNFLLDNTIGAWWANQKLKAMDVSNIDNEKKLRSMLTIPGLSLNYTRFVKEESGSWRPASGIYDKWPNDIKDFKLLDPSCGSGHFLVGALLILVPIRMELEGLSASDAISAVLEENLYGLDIDQRVVEIAVFALALIAWRYPGAGGYRKLPEFNVACIGLDIKNTKEDDWIKLAEGNEKVKNSLKLLYEEFKEAPTLGSLINPREILRDGDILYASGDEVRPYLDKKLDDNLYEYNEMGVKAQGVLKAADIIIQQYSLVITNVPYLKGGDHGAELKRFCERYYPNSKYDLATVFIERSKGFLKKGGTLAVVTQQYWLFLKYYEKLRQKFIKNYDLGLIVRLGPGAFETISGEVVNVCLQITHNIEPKKNQKHYGMELDNIKGIENKINSLEVDPVIIKLQENQYKNPNKRISFELTISDNSTFLSKYADFGKGSVTGDSPHYIRKFWEVNYLNPTVTKWLNSPNSEDIWSGREHVILWDNEEFKPQEELGFALRGQRVLNKKGIAIGKAGKLRFTPYTGELFDDNIVVICPFDSNHIEGIWSYCNSSDFEGNLRKLDKKMSVTAGTFTKVPFDLKWLNEPTNIDINNPYSDDPTQWIFHGHPLNARHALQVAVARLVGYRWPSQIDNKMELSNEAKKLVDKCQDLEEYVDKDGIVCIPSVLGEIPASERLLNLLATAYGDNWNNNTLSSLLSLVEYSGKTIENWLRNKFFIQHCQLFQHRPFIWQVWDGLQDGFSALINYQMLDRNLLERLIYTYLGDWIKKQKNDIEEKIDGAKEKLEAAEYLKKRLELILEGEAPYDIFVRWKSIENQPIGWNPDINDGVRINIRPFMTAPDIGKRGAGILRDKPNINWNKDRGKDVETAPWYHVFNGERVNDYHLTISDKMGARRKRKEDLK